MEDALAIAMGVGRIFSRGGYKGIFPKFFQGGTKVVKFGFLILNQENNPFLLK